MKKYLLGIMIAALALPCCLAEDLNMPVNLDRLASRAKESVNVTLDSSMLQLAGAFLSKRDTDEAQVKKLISNLKGVYVRSFEFDKEGQYSMSDVDAIRSQLKEPAWSRVVGVNSSQGENTDIFMKKNGSQIAGLVVIDAEPKELTVVHIDGAIDPQELSELGGHMGIPKFPKLKSGMKPGK